MYWIEERERERGGGFNRTEISLLDLLDLHDYNQYICILSEEFGIL